MRESKGWLLVMYSVVSNVDVGFHSGDDVLLGGTVHVANSTSYPFVGDPSPNYNPRFEDSNSVVGLHLENPRCGPGDCLPNGVVVRLDVGEILVKVVHPLNAEVIAEITITRPNLNTGSTPDDIPKPVYQFDGR